VAVHLAQKPGDTGRVLAALDQRLGVVDHERAAARGLEQCAEPSAVHPLEIRCVHEQRRSDRDAVPREDAAQMLRDERFPRTGVPDDDRVVVEPYPGRSGSDSLEHFFELPERRGELRKADDLFGCGIVSMVGPGLLQTFRS
jgi:hypothetical protein